jgi:hypothetical protein
MHKVQKPRNPKCNTPSSEPFRNKHVTYQMTIMINYDNYSLLFLGYCRVSEKIYIANAILLAFILDCG